MTEQTTGRRCSTCSSSHRETIEREMQRGTSLPTLTSRYGPSARSLRRHRADHMPTGGEPKEVRVSPEVDAAFDEAEELHAEYMLTVRDQHSQKEQAKALGRYLAAVKGWAQLCGPVDDEPGDEP